VRTVAVVCTYWAGRRKNVARIVDDLLLGTVVPDRIVILDNNWPEVPMDPQAVDTLEHPAVELLTPSWNTECRGKFMAGLLDAANYYLFMDDDTSVQRRTLETLLYWARDTDGGEFVTGYWGVQLRPHPDYPERQSFHHGQIIFPDHVAYPVPVDAFHGRGMFCSFGALVRTLSLEQRVRLPKGEGKEWPNEGDDLIIGLANNGYSWVVPLKADQNFRDLDPGPQAMQHREGYFDMRDEFLQAVLAARSEWSAP
jgi:hypothetical protein